MKNRLVQGLLLPRLAQEARVLTHLIWPTERHVKVFPDTAASFWCFNSSGSVDRLIGRERWGFGATLRKDVGDEVTKEVATTCSKTSTNHYEIDEVRFK